MKIILVTVVFLMFSITSILADDGNSMIADNTIEAQMTKPIITETFPNLNVSALLLKAPSEILQFFNDRGFDSGIFNTLPTPEPMVRIIRSICKTSDAEFCDTLMKVVQKYENTYYEAVVVQLGSIFWTVYI